jgi:hypothetical protein
VECEARGCQGWASLIREGTPHGRTGAPHAVGGRGTPSCEAPCEGAYPTPTLFAFLLRLAVGVLAGLGGLTERMAVTQLVGHSREPRRDGTADGQVAVRHEADQRHRPALPHGPQQDGEVGWGRGQQTAGEADGPGEAVPEDPPHRMADVRLEAIEGEAAPARGGGDALQAGGSGEREGAQCVGALAQMRDRPRGDGHAEVAPVLMDCGQAPGRRRAEGPDARNAIEAKLVRGSGQPALCFRAVGATALRTGTIETAPDGPGERSHVVQGRERTIVMIGGPHRLTAERALTPKRLEGGVRWGSDEVSYVPWGVLSFELLPMVSISHDRRLAHFAILVFFHSVITVLVLTCHTRAVSRIPLAFRATSTICSLTAGDCPG